MMASVLLASRTHLIESHHIFPRLVKSGVLALRELPITAGTSCMLRPALDFQYINNIAFHAVAA